MKNIINFIKNLLGFENPDESMIGISSFRSINDTMNFRTNKTSNVKTEPTLSTLLTRKQFQ